MRERPSRISVPCGTLRGDPNVNVYADGRGHHVDDPDAWVAYVRRENADRRAMLAALRVANADGRTAVPDPVGYVLDAWAAGWTRKAFVASIGGHVNELPTRHTLTISVRRNHDPPSA